MAPIRISVDLCESPLRVGGLLLGKYLVTEGSKGIKLTGDAASTTMEEVVTCLEDARSVAKSYFGGPNFDAAVIVVPNSTTKPHIDHIISYGQHHGFNITQIIHEHTAVAAAYIEKVGPTHPTKLAIISFTGSLLEVSVVSVVYNENISDFQLFLVEHISHDEAIDLVGLTSQVEQVFNLLMNILLDLKVRGGDVEKVVLVGKGAKTEKLKKGVRIKFHDAVVWEEIDAENVAAYGAAFASYTDKRFEIKLAVETTSVPELAGL